MAGRLTDEEKLLRTITESHFQKWVQQVMTQKGWRWYHAADNIPRGGWKANIKPGFPDLIAVRGVRLLVAELKTETGKTTEHQDAWLEELNGTPAEVYVWRPRDKSQIIEILS